MTIRRTCRMVLATSDESSRRRHRPRASKGRIRLLDAMAERATVSTITMAVAAEKPPTKTTAVSSVAPWEKGRSSTYRSGLAISVNTPPAASSGTTARLVIRR